MLVRSLLCEDISDYETLRAFGISVKLAKLPANTLGFVYTSKRQNYYIIINSNINSECQRKVLAHEIKHIVYDMPTTTSIIGIDCQDSHIECEADLFCKCFMKKIKRRKKLE